MVKTRNPQKTIWARNLTLQGMPIKEIQKQLEKMFGSGLSPNELVKMRKDNQMILPKKIPFFSPNQESWVKNIEPELTAATILNELFVLGSELLKTKFEQYENQYELMTSTLEKRIEQLEKNIANMQTQFSQNIANLKEIVTEIRRNVKIADSSFETDPIITIKSKIITTLERKCQVQGQYMPIGYDLQSLSENLDIKMGILEPILKDMIENGLVKYKSESDEYLAFGPED
jgi:DNA-binding transcriptional MerR regulator